MTRVAALVQAMPTARVLLMMAKKISHQPTPHSFWASV
jgi:hypothetical protein